MVPLDVLVGTIFLCIEGNQRGVYGRVLNDVDVQVSGKGNRTVKNLFK